MTFQGRGELASRRALVAGSKITCIPVPPIMSMPAASGFSLISRQI
jgi:hypothetical protein